MRSQMRSSKKAFESPTTKHSQVKWCFLLTLLRESFSVSSAGRERENTAVTFHFKQIKTSRHRWSHYLPYLMAQMCFGTCFRRMESTQSGGLRAWGAQTLMKEMNTKWGDGGTAGGHQNQEQSVQLASDSQWCSIKLQTVAVVTKLTTICQHVKKSVSQRHKKCCCLFICFIFPRFAASILHMLILKMDYAFVSLCKSTLISPISVFSRELNIFKATSYQKP